MPWSLPLKTLLLAASALLTRASPNTCQPRALQPFMPIYHIIGNVTTDDATGEVTQVESINDVSSVIKYKGIYHIFHQCCHVRALLAPCCAAMCCAVDVPHAALCAVLLALCAVRVHCSLCAVRCALRCAACGRVLLRGVPHILRDN